MSWDMKYAKSLLAAGGTDRGSGSAAAGDLSELVFGYYSSSNLIMGQSFFAFRPFKNRSGSHI